LATCFPFPKHPGFLQILRRSSRKPALLPSCMSHSFTQLTFRQKNSDQSFKGTFHRSANPRKAIIFFRCCRKRCLGLWACSRTRLHRQTQRYKIQSCGKGTETWRPTTVSRSCGLMRMGELLVCIAHRRKSSTTASDSTASDSCSRVTT
jgi:hypothetical protein